jgi:hypothetical protein
VGFYLSRTKLVFSRQVVKPIKGIAKICELSCKTFSIDALRRNWLLAFASFYRLIEIDEVQFVINKRPVAVGILVAYFLA